MTRSQQVRWAVLAGSCLAVTAAACRVLETDRLFLLNSNVNIPAGNGSRELMFQGLGGQIVTVSLSAVKRSMVPIATLVTPDGAESATPAAGTSADGFNSASATLPRDGTYRLIVRDGTGQGGQVTVRVELGAS